MVNLGVKDYSGIYADSSRPVDFTKYKATTSGRNADNSQNSIFQGSQGQQTGSKTDFSAKAAYAMLLIQQGKNKEAVEVLKHVPETPYVKYLLSLAEEKSDKDVENSAQQNVSGDADKSKKDSKTFDPKGMSTADMGYSILGISKNGSADEAANNVFNMLQKAQSSNGLSLADVDGNGNVDDADMAIIRAKIDTDGDGIINKEEAAEIGSINEMKGGCRLSLTDYFSNVILGNGGKNEQGSAATKESTNKTSIYGANKSEKPSKTNLTA